MNNRSKLIADLADDIACGTPAEKYDAAFFLDALLDSRRVTSDHVAVLLTMSEHSDAHNYVSDYVREMVKQSAVEFFTSDPRGADFIDEKLAEERAEAEADAEYRMKYERGEPDGDTHEELLIHERAA